MVRLSLICLHVSAALFLACGATLAWKPLLDARTADRELFWLGVIGTAMLVGVCALLVAGVEVIAHGVALRRRWAWIAAIGLFATYIPSLFLPLGVLGLWGLLDRRTRDEFGVKLARANTDTRPN
jgi:hypothetical protein